MALPNQIWDNIIAKASQVCMMQGVCGNTLNVFLRM